MPEDPPPLSSHSNLNNNIVNSCSLENELNNKSLFQKVGKSNKMPRIKIPSKKEKER